MEYKVTVSDPKTGKSYQQEVKDEKARRLNGKKIGETFDGAILGLTGYTLEITGGSDKCGFPMKKGVKGSARARILMREGTGYRPKGKVRKKKTVRGERIDENIVQINTKTVKAGSKSIESLLGVTSKEKPEEGKEEVKEEKPPEPAKSPEGTEEKEAEPPAKEAKSQDEAKPPEEKPKEEAEKKEAEPAKSQDEAEAVKSPEGAEEKKEG